MPCNLKISRNYYHHDFSPTPSLDDKITIFDDRVRGWLIDMVDEMINTSCAIHPGLASHGGFAALMTLASYFETLAKMRAGYCREGRSSAYFTKGLDWVFPAKFSEEEARLVYREVRCGLYHAAITGPRVVLSATYSEALSCQPDISGTFVVANPHLLPKVLRGHLESYVKDLRDRNAATLRTNFERYFDWLGGGPAKVVPTW